VELLCGGDRMWPAVDEPRRVRVEPCDPASLREGDVVVAAIGRIPDLLRVIGCMGGQALRLRGDADLDEPVEVPVSAVVGRVRAKRRRVGHLGRRCRRLSIDLREALLGARGGSDETDRAQSVREKYDVQAPFYVGIDSPDLEETLTCRIVRGVKPAGRVLVVGSGVGRECFALAEGGFEVRGVDFAPAMIEHARRGADERGLDVEFVEADIRVHEEGAGSLAGVLFTYDVFSFLPDPAERVRLLRRMSGWLAREGLVFLSARLVRRGYERLILTLQWLRGAGRRGVSWGDSHTRYLAPDGSLRRSYVHYFTPRRLRDEAKQAGLRLDHWSGGHVELRRSGTRSPVKIESNPDTA
jgi:2-polyprenyl-3-methyl-5-hydroxy-6-metoxy-1,4-benzoquinol methylase